MKKLIALSLLVAAVLAAPTFAAAQGGGGGQRGGQRGFAQRGANAGLSGLLRRPDVQADLALTDEQKTKVSELRGAGRGQRGAGGGAGAGGGGQRGQQLTPEQIQERLAAEHKQLEAILTPEQMKRLEEIQIQVQGDRAILLPNVQKELDLTDDQKAKVKDLQSKFQEAMRSVMEKVRSGEMERSAVQETMQKNNKTLGEELHKVLTPAQVDKLKTLGGKPFKADTPAGGR